MDLEMVGTEELWNELKKRYNACLLIYEKDGDKGNTSVVNAMWEGSLAHVFGFSSWMQKYCDVYFKALMTQDGESEDFEESGFDM